MLELSGFTRSCSRSTGWRDDRGSSDILEVAQDIKHAVGQCTAVIRSLNKPELVVGSFSVDSVKTVLEFHRSVLIVVRRVLWANSRGVMELMAEALDRSYLTGDLSAVFYTSLDHDLVAMFAINPRATRWLLTAVNREVFWVPFISVPNVFMTTFGPRGFCLEAHPDSNLLQLPTIDSAYRATVYRVFPDVLRYLSQTHDLGWQP